MTYVRAPWVDLSKAATVTPRADERIARNAKMRAALKQVYAFVDARDQGQCRACGRRVKADAKQLEARAHRHHVVFRSAGGQNTTANLAVTCLSCHTAIHHYRLTCSGDANGRLTFSTEQKTWTSEPPAPQGREA